MKVLIACEESQTVCKAFRAKGHEAYSCDALAETRSLQSGSLQRYRAYRQTR